MNDPAPPTSLGLARYGQGRDAFARLLDSWLKASGLPLMTWCRVAEQALGASKLHPSQLSSLRNGLVSNLSVYVFDALAAVSEARHDLEEGKVCKVTGALRESLRQIPLLRYGKEPAGLADLVCIYAGLQEPPAIEGWHGVTRLNAAEMSDALGRVIRRVINEQGTDLLDGLAELLKAFPSKDASRLNMARMVALGLGSYEEDQAKDEAVAVCQALSRLTGDDWTMDRVLEELDRPKAAR